MNSQDTSYRSSIIEYTDYENVAFVLHSFSKN